MKRTDVFKSKSALANERDYWRDAYETLVKQSGRDLNDGLGPDPRKTWSKPEDGGQ